MLLLSYFFRSVLILVSVLCVIITSIIHYPVISDNTLDNSAFLPENDISVASSGNTTINVLKYRTNLVFELSKAYDLYTDESGGAVHFSMQTVNETDYFFTLRSKLLSGEKVDLFTLSRMDEFHSLREFIQDLSGNEWVKEAYPDALGAIGEEGAVLGVPYSVEAVGFLFNQEIFDYADISVLEINSLDDLADIFSKLNEKIISGELSERFPELEAVTEFPALDRNFLDKCFADIVLSNTFKSASNAAFAETRSITAPQSAEEILKLMMRYSLSGNDWARAMNITNSMQLERFANYRVAVILQNTGAYRRILDINPMMKGRTSLVSVPLIDFETPVIYTGAPFYWAINAQSGAGAAMDFLKWLYTSDSGAKYFADELQETSPFLDYAHDTGIVLHRQMLRYMRADMSMPQVHSGLPQNLLAVNIQNYITERNVTWQDVIISCEEAWNADVTSRPR